MAFKLIGKDMSLRISVGGVVDGTPTYGTAVEFLCIARSVGLSIRMDTVDVSGLCDSARRYRPTKWAGELSLESAIMSSGYQFSDAGGILIGNYIKVETKESSAMTAYRVWEGVITGWEWSSQGEEMQIERITIQLNPEKDNV
jgi:hypothetical protein